VTDADAFNNCTEADKWIIDAATAKHVARLGMGASEAAVPLTAAQLIALSDRQRAVYRGALAYLGGLDTRRGDGLAWEPRSGTWATPQGDDEAP
jgi:hypothetical protein